MTTSARNIAGPSSTLPSIAAPVDEAMIASATASSGSPALPARRISFLAWGAAGAAGVAMWVLILRFI